MSEIVVGIHKSLSWDEYKAIRAVNSGVVSAGYVSMKHMRAALDGEFVRKDTDDMKLGRAIHCRLLEPERYTREFLIATKCSRLLSSGTNKGKRCSSSGRFYDGANWFCGTHKPDGCNEPQDYIDEAEAAQAEAVAESLKHHDVMRLFLGECWTELSCVWESRGVLRKCRIDRYSREPRPRVLDVKKCLPGKGSRDEFEKSVHKFGYHRQMAGNIEAVEALEGVSPEGIWVVVEDGPPYDVNIIPANPQTIAIGRHENNDIIGRFAAAQQRNDYRGYVYDSRFIRHGGLPLWYIEQCMRIGIGTSDDSTAAAHPEYADFGDAPRTESHVIPVADAAAVD